MDLSALIFVALAVAWAVYLIPKALKHHDEVVRSRSVEKFSHTMRVLARREPVDRRNARLVVSPTRASLRPPVETKPRTAAVVTDASVTTTVTREVTASVAARPLAPQAERASARRAAKRRRNVLALVVLANAAIGAIQEGRAERSMAAVTSLSSPSASRSMARKRSSSLPTARSEAATSTASA